MTEREFTPETLQLLVDEVEKLRLGYLCDIDGAGADPVAEQHYLMGLCALEQAKHYFALANLSQVRALALADRKLEVRQ